MFLKYHFSWKKTTIAVYENPDNGYSVVFEQLGMPFFFGASNVRITLEDEQGRKVERIETQIYNEGGVEKRNAEVLWEDDKVTVILSGCEQNDEAYEFSID
ncbi:MAG: hypothetical protein J6A83_02225 [Clostridia bacterium]|nr:hypothetical protein [Clostridia bacterium]